MIKKTNNNIIIAIVIMLLVLLCYYIYNIYNNRTPGTSSTPSTPGNNSTPGTPGTPRTPGTSGTSPPLDVQQNLMCADTTCRDKNNPSNCLPGYHGVACIGGNSICDAAQLSAGCIPD